MNKIKLTIGLFLILLLIFDKSSVVLANEQPASDLKDQATRLQTKLLKSQQQTLKAQQRAINELQTELAEIKKAAKRLPVNGIQAIVNRGKLVVAMYARDTPPFYYRDKNNVLTGIDVVLIKGFADLLGVSIEFDRSAKFIGDVVSKVENHEVDLAICKLSSSFDRAKHVLFTDPYINLHQSLLINRLELAKQLQGRPEEEVIQKLTGKIGVLTKTAHVGYAKYFKGMEVVEYTSWDQIIDDARNGKITAAFRDEAEIKMILRDKPDMSLQLLSVILKDANDPKAIAISFDNRNLHDLINFYIKSLSLDLTADKIVNDYDNVIKRLENKIKQRI